MVLDSEPTADVTVNVTSGDETEGTVDQSTLTFNATNWNVAQTVTVTGVDDNIDDGDVSYTVSTSTTSVDGNYVGLTGTDVTLTNTDDDAIGITISETVLTIAEGKSATFNVVLNSEPTADAIVILDSSDPTEGIVDQPTLTFNAANWNIPQPVTVTGVTDGIDDGDVPYTITTTVSSGDPNYLGFELDDVTVTTTDIDVSLNDIGIFNDEANPFADLITFSPSEDTNSSDDLCDCPPLPGDAIVNSATIAFTTLGTDAADTLDGGATADTCFRFRRRSVRG